MPLAQEIENLAKTNAEPLKFLNDARGLLKEACSKGGECDPLGTNANEGYTAYRYASNHLFKNGFTWAAEQLIFEWWNDFGLRQLVEKKHIHRASIAYALMIMYAAIGDRGAALRWALLTQTDDVLSEHGEGGGAGKQLLRSTLGMSEAELEELNSIVRQNMDVIRKKYSDDWTNPEGFAENAVIRFALRKLEFAHLFAQESSAQEFPLSSAYFSTLLRHVDAADRDTAAKGVALEDLASYLFLLIPGWVPSRNIIDEDWAFETDIVVSNLSQASNLSAELLGRHFLVECKNWAERVGVKDVGYFLYRMRLTHAKFGVILAKSGITGSEADENAARSLIRRAFHEDGNICVVLNRDDLDTLATGTVTFWSMLLGRIERIRFGKPRQPKTK